MGASFGTEVGLHRAGDSPDRPRQASAVPVVGATTWPRTVSISKRFVRQAAHTLSEPEERILASAGARHRRALHDVGSAAECGVPVSERHAERRPHREGRSADLRDSPAVAESRRSRESDVGVFRRARTASARRSARPERLGAGESVLRELAEVRVGSRRAARCRQYSGVGVFAAHRRGEPESPVVSSLPETAQADDGRRRAPLLRSVCAARRLGEPRVHAGRGAQAHRRSSRRRSAPTTLRRSIAHSTSAGSI